VGQAPLLIAGRKRALGIVRPVARLRKRSAAALVAIVVAVLVGACGGDGDEPSAEIEPETSSGVQQEPDAAADPQPSEFPEADGQTLQELADLSSPGINFAPATTHYTTGPSRMAFGLIDANNEFVYAPSAVYIGRTPDDRAIGPYLAPADSLITEQRFRSQQAATEEDAIASIYSAEVDLPVSGQFAVLVLTRAGDELYGTTAQIEVAAEDSIPAPGERPPAVETDTLESAGQIEAIDTREPPSDLHSNFADVVGERPVALLFATPALCQSRVCGPVTDIAVQLEEEYGDRMEFIHQEVFVDNEVDKGLRDPLLDFGLETEPWLFTVDGQGRVVARLEGSFGLGEFEEAVQAAL